MTCLGIYVYINNRMVFESEILLREYTKKGADYVKVIWALPHKDVVLGYYEYKMMESFMNRNKIKPYQVLDINVPIDSEFRSKLNYGLKIKYDKTIKNKRERDKSYGRKTEEDNQA